MNNRVVIVSIMYTKPRSTEGNLLRLLSHQVAGNYVMVTSSVVEQIKETPLRDRAVRYRNRYQVNFKRRSAIKCF